jgi:hypothetical protein
MFKRKKNEEQFKGNFDVDDSFFFSKLFWMEQKKRIVNKDFETKKYTQKRREREMSIILICLRWGPMANDKT